MQRSNCFARFSGVFLVSLLCLADALAKPSEVVRIPFELYSHHFIVVSGSLNGSPGRSLLIDTGTNPTMVDAATARELRLEKTASEDTKINVLGGVVPSYCAVLDHLDFGLIHRDSVPVAITDLSWAHQEIGVHIDAVVGVDVLLGATFQIDYQSKQISFGMIRVPNSAVPVTNTARFLTVQARLNGSPLNLLLDTGGSTLVLSARGLPVSLRPLAGERIKLSNLGGETFLERVQVKELKIGKTNLGFGSAVVGEIRADGTIQGILGISSLRFKRVTFDLAALRVGFELQNMVAPTLQGARAWFGSEPATYNIEPMRTPMIASHR